MRLGVPRLHAVTSHIHRRRRQNRLPTWAPASSLLALAGWFLFAGYLLAQALAGPAIIWNDSDVYMHIAARSVLSKAFWAGPRPPATPLMIDLVGSSNGFLAAQALIAALSWGFLAWTVGRLVAPGWRRVTATWVILAFATAFPITLWNRSVLSESLSLSLLALLFATLIWAARRLTWPRVAATTAVCLCFAATRDAQVWTVGFLALAVGVGALLAVRRDRGLAVRAGTLAIGLAAVVVLTGWGTVSSHRTKQNVADVFFVRVFPYPDRVAWFAAHGMPDQQQIDLLAKATTTAPGEAKAVFFSASDPTFAPLEHWINSQGTDTYGLWLLTHPGYLVTEPLLRPERAFNFAHGSLTFYAASTRRLQSPLTIVLWPPLIGLLVLAGVAAYASVLSRAWRQGVWRMVFALTVIGVLSMLVAWHGDGQEVTRHTVEGLAEVRLGLWIMVVLWLTGPMVGSPGHHGMSRLPTPRHGPGQSIDHRDGLVPSDASVGDALPEDK